MPIAQYVTVLVVRSELSKTPKTCLAHEIPLLEERWGKANIRLVGVLDVGRDVSIDAETDRLQRVYGPDDEGPSIFDRVYPRGTRAFQEAIAARFTEDDLDYSLIPRKPIKLPNEDKVASEIVPLHPATEEKVIAPVDEEPVEQVLEKDAIVAKLTEWGVEFDKRLGKDKLIPVLEESARARLAQAGFEGLDHLDFDEAVAMADSLDPAEIDEAASEA